MTGDDIQPVTVRLDVVQDDMPTVIRSLDTYRTVITDRIAKLAEIIDGVEGIPPAVVTLLCEADFYEAKRRNEAELVTVDRLINDLGVLLPLNYR